MSSIVAPLEKPGFEYRRGEGYRESKKRLSYCARGRSSRSRRPAAHARRRRPTSSRTISYDAASNRTRLTWPDGYYAGYSYDAAERMIAANENGSATLAAFDYDALGHRAWVQYGSGAPAAKVSYSWSTESDLLTLSHDLASSANDVAFTDSYTPAGQIADSTLGNAAYAFTPASYFNTYAAADKANRYPSVALNGGPAVAVAYDGNGNLTSDGTWTYAYDPENRLMSATGPGVAAAYAYDPLGRRSRKSGGGVAATYFLDDGDSEIAEYDGTSGALQRRFVPGAGIDDDIAMVTASGTKTFFHQDKLGSVVAMSDTSGNLAEGPYTYDAFGNGAPTTGVPFKYTGRRLDPETGLYFYRARYYSPGIGRFLQPDSIGYGDDLNNLMYVHDDPSDLTDPSGNEAVDEENRLDPNFGGSPSNPDPPPDVNNVANAIDFATAITTIAEIDATLGGAALGPAEVTEIAGHKLANEVRSLAGGSKATTPYTRPSHATTPAQRASVQGQKCAKCNAPGDKMIAGHKKDLVREYHETGTIDKDRMRSPSAVQPECSKCSTQGGADASRYSREMNKKLTTPPKQVGGEDPMAGGN